MVKAKARYVHDGGDLLGSQNEGMIAAFILSDRTYLTFTYRQTKQQQVFGRVHDPQSPYFRYSTA